MKTVFNADGSKVNLLVDTDIKKEGNCIKLPDGTMIIYGIIEHRNASSTSVIDVVFEHPFIDYPYITITNRFTHRSNLIWSVGSKNNVEFKAYFNIADGVPFQANQTADFEYIAIGRWK